MTLGTLNLIKLQFVCLPETTHPDDTLKKIDGNLVFQTVEGVGLTRDGTTLGPTYGVVPSPNYPSKPSLYKTGLCLLPNRLERPVKVMGKGF